MRSFPVPIQITEEEKIFGGKLSLRQTIYLFILGPGLGFALAKFCPFGGWLTNISLFLIGMLLGTMFAFIKVQDIGLDAYVWLAVKWWRSPRVYTWDENTKIH